MLVKVGLPSRYLLLVFIRALSIQPAIKGFDQGTDCRLPGTTRAEQNPQEYRSQTSGIRPPRMVTNTWGGSANVDRREVFAWRHEVQRYSLALFRPYGLSEWIGKNI